MWTYSGCAVRICGGSGERNRTHRFRAHHGVDAPVPVYGQDPRALRGTTTKRRTQPPPRCTAGGVADTSARGGTCRFLLVLPSIQTVLSAPDFHRFGLSCGRTSLAESWRPARMRRFVRFLPACESGSRAVTAGSEFHRPRSTMTLLIMPQRGRGAYFLAAGINYVTK